MSFKTSCYYAPRSYTRDREFGYGQILYHLYLSLSLYCYCIVFKAWFCRSLKFPCKIWTKQTNKSKGYKKNLKTHWEHASTMARSWFSISTKYWQLSAGGPALPKGLGTTVYLCKILTSTFYIRLPVCFIRLLRSAELVIGALFARGISAEPRKYMS